MPAARHRAAVLGKPVSHSLSPVIHRAGYAAAGLADWSYAAHECAEDELAGFLSGLGPEWAGLSLTMPLKHVAAAAADQSSWLVEALGAANTLVRRDDRWVAENTDAPGMADAIRGAGLRQATRVVVLGAGGTARAALAAATQLGAEQVAVHARRAEALAQLALVAERLSAPLLPRLWDTLAESVATADLVISTVPAGVADVLAAMLDKHQAPDRLTVFDVIYHPWPTVLAGAAAQAGCRVVNGLDLLLAQAVRQFELFTEIAAPEAAMRQALRAAVS